MQLNFVVRQGNSAITLSFVNPSPMGEGFQLLETLLQLHKLCSYIICSIKYTCTIYQFTQKIPHTLFKPTKSLFHLRDELITRKQNKHSFPVIQPTKIIVFFYFTHPAADRLNFVLPTLFHIPTNTNPPL